ncbi:uncharacterized protein HKW66_Vig0200870 [Vigna angularis]|uniref:Uncharacterized protein n=1 Tax=Phaseolus angularis TaxID=3914 RepID=A0A8T0JR28_PHAAN|nr:uncharacterized protein HKW66_Vig0200870 [Vigna angularis]
MPRSIIATPTTSPQPLRPPSPTETLQCDTILQQLVKSKLPLFVDRCTRRCFFFIQTKFSNGENLATVIYDYIPVQLDSLAALSSAMVSLYLTDDFFIRLLPSPSSSAGGATVVVLSLAPLRHSNVAAENNTRRPSRSRATTATSFFVKLLLSPVTASSPGIQKLPMSPTTILESEESENSEV